MIVCQTPPGLASHAGFGEEDCAKCLHEMFWVIDGRGCVEAQMAWDEGGLGPEARLQELMTDHLQQDALTQEKLDYQKQRKQELGPQEAARGPQHGVSVGGGEGFR
jgi:hypothetical protein